MGLLIVGGGRAAQRCIEVLRAAGDDRAVTVVCAEPARPYDRPPLSKEGLLRPGDTAFRDEAWYREHDGELRLGVAARALDAPARRVLLASGAPLRYDALLIATGAAARTLPGLPRACVLRTRCDAERFRARLADGRPVAVVGAGLIGLEAAASARALGAEVTVVEAAPRPLAGILGPRAGAWLMALHRAQGVVLRTGVTVERDRRHALPRRPRAGRRGRRPRRGLAGRQRTGSDRRPGRRSRANRPSECVCGGRRDRHRALGGGLPRRHRRRTGAARTRPAARLAPVVLERSARRSPAVRRRPA